MNPLPVLERTPMSNSSAPTRPSVLDDLSQTDRETLRRLARRYRLRGNGTVRPAADVAYDLRSRHKLDVTTPDVHALLKEAAAS